VVEGVGTEIRTGWAHRVAKMKRILEEKKEKKKKGRSKKELRTFSFSK